VLVRRTSRSAIVPCAIALLAGVGGLLSAPPLRAQAPDEIVYYCLNGSNSKSWAQVTPAGLAGMCLFERFPGSEDTGDLVYRTIAPSGSEEAEIVATGTRMEKSVLLYDADSRPHIFVARSNDLHQVVEHYSRPAASWVRDTLMDFRGEGGRFIYELSAARGPDGSFHLLVLKTRSDVDSDDFQLAWLDANLYHLTNASGTWRRELIRHYDMAYTYDFAIKTSCRQDIQVDADGFVHVVYSQQINGTDDPSRLWYATNRSGTWTSEIALDFAAGSRDDAGWFPSLCLDRHGTPHVACAYVARYYTYSVRYATLLLLTRTGAGVWQQSVIADRDDGYYGNDGRVFTGALSHLVFDASDTPHIAFSDIASSHWGYNRLNVGNIRYGVFRDGAWDLRTIHRQPLPTGFRNATEMYGLCLLLSPSTGTVRVIGQELIVDGVEHYESRLVKFAWAESLADVPAPEYGLAVQPGAPNPFSSLTTIRYVIPARTLVTIAVYDVRGRRVRSLESASREAGPHAVDWDGRDDHGRPLAEGLYFCRFQAGSTSRCLKVALVR
jgi:hypothetical protein